MVWPLIAEEKKAQNPSLFEKCDSENVQDSVKVEVVLARRRR
jgi:hypothetical protein